MWQLGIRVSSREVQWARKQSGKGNLCHTVPLLVLNGLQKVLIALTKSRGRVHITPDQIW